MTDGSIVNTLFHDSQILVSAVKIRILSLRRKGILPYLTGAYPAVGDVRILHHVVLGEVLLEEFPSVLYVLPRLYGVVVGVQLLGGIQMALGL